MNAGPHDESPQGSSNTSSLLCRICNQPVPIETARTDSDGKAVHGDCYVHEINGHDGRVKEQTRPWLAIAEELSHEQDSGKVGKLAVELNKALDEAEAESHPPIQKKPDGSRLRNDLDNS